MLSEKQLHPFLTFNGLVLLQVVLMVLLTIAARLSGWRAGSFGLASILVTVGVYALVFIGAWSLHDEESRLRSEYPLESMEDRLPVRAGSQPTVVLPAETLKNLDEQEENVHTGHRSYMLKQLHEHHLNTFINSPSFGQVRQIVHMNAP